MRCCNGCTSATVPGISLNDMNYGFVDIGYEIGSGASAVPLPATLPLAAAGFRLLFAAARRRA